MVAIQYPEPSFRTRNRDGKEYIFDAQRRKWLLLTPEEWVRQNFIQFLIQVKNYPASLIAIEKEIWLGDLKKRFDILVYDSNHRPWMMIECKGMDVPLDDDVLNQVLRYNVSIPVPFLVVTNGRSCYALARSPGHLKILDHFPYYGEQVE